jgi:hypothetical protein
MSERIQNLGDNRNLEYKGVKYRSNLEVDTAKVLDALNIPFEYESRKIVLQEGFRCPYQKDKVRALTYTPDFLIGPIMLECKGFETPEWKIKKKMVFKWLMENEPETIFYQTHDAKKSILDVLDNHWSYLGIAVQVSPKPKKNMPSSPKLYDSVSQAMKELGLSGKSKGAVLRSLTGNTMYVYGYNWKLVKLKL